MSKYDLHFQPEDLIPNVVFSPEKAYLSKEDKEKLGDRIGLYDCETKLLCRACGWNTYHEVGSSYLPRLRIFRTRKNSGLWTIGNDYVMWDRPGDKGTETSDYMTWKFLRGQDTKIPLVNEMFQLGNEGDPFHFTIMSRVKGVPLENVYDELSTEQKRRIADQLVAVLRELRQYTAPAPQRADGSPLWDNIVAQCWGARLCKTILPTKEEWLDSIDEELRAGLAKQQTYNKTDTRTIDARIQEMRDKFPESSTFVLTHGDLNLGNIIVDPEEGKILAIIDWELAGYYPQWVERWAAANRALDPRKAFELFDMVYSQLDPEVTRTNFATNTSSHVNKVARCWQTAPVEHTQSHDVWLRPRWCECKPWGGKINRAAWDAEMKHSVGEGGKEKTLDRWMETLKVT